ncbi:MAG: hypothetical protein KF869_05955 [Phycisphaeraceae bacterium]|nr:hypothetical protein [Phycisphaeraceae bacterium]
MGLFQRIFGAVARPDPGVRHPGGGFDSPAAAMADLVRRHNAANDIGWVDLTCSALGKRVCVQLCGDHLNTLLEELPPDVCASLGLERVGDGLYRLPDASPAAVAATIDALLTVHFELGVGYALAGSLEY